MKKKILVFTAIAVIIIVVGALVYNLNKPEEKVVKTTTKDIFDSFLNKKSTKEELLKLTGDINVDPFIMLGKDSDLREEPGSDVIKKYDLKDYEDKHMSYVDKLENMIVSNTHYKIKESTVDSKGISIQTVKITGFYYGMFFMDWIQLSMDILKEANYEFKNTETDVSTQVAFYKAKVKALEIMSSSFKNYENKGESVEVEIICKNGVPKDSGQMNTLLTNLRGMNYKDMTSMNDKNMEAYKNRVNKYYEKAVNDKTLDEKSPLELK